MIDKSSILIVDDEHEICNLLCDELSEEGYLCDIALDGDSALRKLEEKNFALVLLDIKLPGRSGIELLQEISHNYCGTVVIMITALDDVSTAVETMKLGAIDYIVKPFDLGKIKSSVSVALEVKNCVRERKGYYILDNNLYYYTEENFTEIDAIAQGVEAKLNLCDNHFDNITERTARIAEELEIDEDQIQGWLEMRTHINGRNQAIVHKFEGSSIAQIKMGIAKEYRYDIDSDFFGS
jgi:DNA-binding response OmpR family regulator